uniref:ribonuclease H n=1 Tax=Gouania willdenowi TaxID=441366 RepID=A0A8C5EI19_GOUWI
MMCCCNSNPIAGGGLLGMRQGTRTVSDYSIDFRTRALQSQWNAAAQTDAYLLGLNDYIKDELVSHDLPSSLDKLIELATRLDRCIQARRQEKRHRIPERLPVPRPRPPVDVNHFPAPHDGGPEPMQVGRTRLSPEEREHRRQRNLCLYCGKPSHYIIRCPVKGARSSVERGVLMSLFSTPSPIKRPHFQARLLLKRGTHTLTTLIDSGSDICLLDENLAQQLEIKSVPLPASVPDNALDGRLLGTITHRTVPVHLVLAGRHHETVQFHILKTPQHPVILGFPWLHRHNPHIDWSMGSFISWSPYCHQICLKQAIPALLRSDTSGPPSDLQGLPEEYHDLQEVFSKTRATSLPPHRSYDCSIDLLPGTSPPRIYSLSGPEREVMEKYVNESLAAGLIRPSSSPAGAGFFFVEKKDKTLRPCIDYRGLNNITVKNRYPLPLISSAFELLQDAVIFTKLDLRNAYHLVRIREADEWKTALTVLLDTTSIWLCHSVSPTLPQFSRPWLMMFSVTC